MGLAWTELGGSETTQEAAAQLLGKRRWGSRGWVWRRALLRDSSQVLCLVLQVIERDTNHHSDRQLNYRQ